MLGVCLALIDDENDKKTFREFYDEYERKLFAYSMSILHNAALAEEAVSETFLSLAKSFIKIHNFEPTEMVAYTVIINRNVCFDILKKEYKHKPEITAEDFTESKEYSSFKENVQNLIIADIVEKLPDAYRDVIMMKYFYGFTVKEIADQLRMSVGGVKSRLVTARKLLRKELDAYG